MVFQISCVVTVSGGRSRAHTLASYLDSEQFFKATYSAKDRCNDEDVVLLKRRHTQEYASAVLVF
jgi:hypothetical protein